LHPAWEEPYVIHKNLNNRVYILAKDEERRKEQIAAKRRRRGRNK